MHRFARLLLSVCSALLALPALLALVFMPASARLDEPLRIGLVGLDTSHVTAFTALLNDPARPDHLAGGRVVAGYRGGSPDVESSASRVDGFTRELREKWGVKIVDSIEELCREVDVVCLMSVDGRTHLQQIRPIFAARKRVFIDKPFAGNLRDAQEIVRLARESGTPFFSSSSLRYVDEIQALRTNEKLAGIIGAMAWSPSPTEPHHPDLFWYGIHGVETLYTLMGPGCESVTRTFVDGADVVTGRWRNGRIGTFRGIRDGQRTYGAVAFGNKAVLATSAQMKVDYRGLLVEIMKFFRSGTPPITPEETLEIMAFMEAADLSKARGGAPVALKDLLK